MPAPLTGRGLTARQLEVLRRLRLSGMEWHRPMDVGGRNNSHHCHTLSQLVARGLVERERRCTAPSARASFVYRLTEAGRNVAPNAWGELPVSRPRTRTNAELDPARRKARP